MAEIKEKHLSSLMFHSAHCDTLNITGEANEVIK